jgi:hypothetical protein
MFTSLQSTRTTRTESFFDFFCLRFFAFCVSPPPFWGGGGGGGGGWGGGLPRNIVDNQCSHSVTKKYIMDARMCWEF